MPRTGPACAAARRHGLLEALRAARVVTVVRTGSAEHATTAVHWLRECGLGIFEISMAVPDAPALIREFAADPALVIGAGTVPDAIAAQACLEAGARFIAAPWVDYSLAPPCRSAGALLVLGAMTPSEIRAAITAGADVVNIFPVAALGGPAHVRAMRGAFPRLAFCASGGIAPDELGAYLAAGADFVGIGRALVDEPRIAAGDRAAIAAAARQAG